MTPLKKIHDKKSGPVVLCIMDGIGYGKFNEGDAFFKAHTPNLDYLHKNHFNIPLYAHGTLVGLPDDTDMGNSEVGHNAIGGGKIVSQGAKLVNNAINTKELFQGKTWQNIINQIREKNSSLHFLGLLSDGNIHSHIKHLKSMIQQAKIEGAKQVFIHILLDGRDVGETSALEYVDDIENFMHNLNDSSFNAKIASGGGRMTITMDRYNANWQMVEEGYNTHVHGEGKQFSSARKAIEYYRNENNYIDQNLPSFVIAENNNPVGKIIDNDAVIFFNFRGDRSIEISQALSETNFTNFDRKNHPNILYAGMMEYDGDNHIPENYLVDPPVIDTPLAEYMTKANISQFAISETQKFGHVTFFFNGNRSDKFDDKLETFCEIPSFTTPFEHAPWMMASQITDEVIKQIYSNKQDFIRLNYANGDMVGHTGDFEATVLACQVVDLQIGRLMQAIKKTNGTLIITADHGNADDMFERNKKGEINTDKNGKAKAKTSHSLNLVPFIIYNPSNQFKFESANIENPGLSNIAACCLNLCGFQEPDDFNKSLIRFK